MITMDKIKIRGLEIWAKHGVFPEENVLGQKFVISADLYTNTRSAGKSDDLTQSIHYGEVCQFMKTFMEEHTYQLIETVAEKDPAAAAFIVKTTQYFVPMAGKIDAEAERKKLADDLAYYEGFLASVMKKLSNERFVASAPEKVVANERAKQADAEAKITAIREQLAALESGK